MRTVICPECGKVTEIDDAVFDLGVVEGRIKEIRSVKADGILWDEDCK